MQVNRNLKNKEMDAIDHALGRPLDPQSETYRNYYAAEQSLAIEMGKSPYWSFNGRSLGDRALSFFSVTDEGRAALAAHLKEIGDPHRSFIVEFEGNESIVAATSRSKARYSKYLDVSDGMPDLTYSDFMRRSTVRVASRTLRVDDRQVFEGT